MKWPWISRKKHEDAVLALTAVFNAQQTVMQKQLSDAADALAHANQERMLANQQREEWRRKALGVGQR